MKALRVRPRVLWALIAGAAALVVIVVVTVIAATAASTPTRLGAAFTDPQTPGTVPEAVASSPHPTLGPTHTERDTQTLTSEPWMFVNLDGRTLELTYVAGDGHCIFPRGFAVTSTKTSVQVWALSKTGDQKICGDLYNMGHVSLILPEPLNGRKLEHAPTDQNWTTG